MARWSISKAGRLLPTCAAACISGAILLPTTLLLLGTSQAFSQSSNEFLEESAVIDTSGTNPAVLSRTFQITNEYRWFGDNQFYNVTNMRIAQPFQDGKAAIRLTVPMNASNFTGEDEWGLGDIAAKLTYIPYSTNRQAFILSTEMYAPTATQDVLGTGKWVAAPGFTWANFLSPEVIVAPAYIHNWSFAGDDDRRNVNRGDFDFYVVYRPQGKRWWITSDTTISHDFEADKTPVSWELSFGRNIKMLEGGAALNGYIRQGIGFGNDRPYDFNLEAGVSLVNF